jgi:hypothetical protein
MFATEVIQSLNTKVVDPVLLYNFHKGRRIFSPPFLYNLNAKITDFWVPVNSNPGC